MPSPPVCLAFAFLFSVSVAQPPKIQTRRVVGKEVKVSYIIQKSATPSIPDACKPQKKCPTEPGFFTCGVYKGGDCTAFCSRTIRQYQRRLAGCRKSPSALGSFLLLTNCKTQCGRARRQRMKRSPVLGMERKLLRDNDCDASCKALILSQVRDRRSDALVVTAMKGSNYRSGFRLFAPWVWERESCGENLCGNPLRVCSAQCAGEGEQSCWFCAQFGTACTTSCSTCWDFSLDCNVPS